MDNTIEKRIQSLNDRLSYTRDIFAGKHEDSIRLLDEKLTEFTNRVRNGEVEDPHTEIVSLEDLFVFVEKRLEKLITPMDRVRIVRHPQRICLRDILENVYDNYTEIGGQGEHTNDPAMVIARAYITRRLTVRSNRAQIHFERHYDRVDYALQILTGVISEIASDSYAEQIENEVTSIFKTFEDNIDKAIESTAAMARKRGISERNARSEYDRPRTYETPIRSPFSVRYLNLIEKYDLINAALDCLWLNGYMATRVHVQSTGLWETRFRRLSTDLNNLRIRALREAAEESNRRMRAGDEEIRREARRAVDEKEGAASREAAEPKNESAETQGAVDKAD